jgi:hypothetical protein
MNAVSSIPSSQIGMHHMTQLILDASALVILPKLTESVEILDESGKTLGHFHPSPRPEASQSPFAREELERRRLQRTGRPLADILRDLEAL